MILRRIIAHLRKQEWTAIGIDFVIVVVGVFIGIQVADWNDERLGAQRREQVVAAVLATDLRDSQDVLENFERNIDAGLAGWQEEVAAAGDLPPPYFIRIMGSDTPPRTWETLQSMEIGDALDPVTLFDLSFYYSVLGGYGVKYLRYVVFVENEILSYLNGPRSHFYTADRSALKPEYAANMERARDIARQFGRLARWNACLTSRLEASRTFDDTCNNADYRL